MFATQHGYTSPAASQHEPEPSVGARFLESIARAIIREDPPLYSRGAWAIISDVPYPGPPPYAGSRNHPPTYEEALEIGVVASPLRIEQRMRRRSRQTPPSTTVSIGRAASAPELTAAASALEVAGSLRAQSEPAAPEDTLLPGTLEDGDALLPAYEEAPLSPVVRQWRLGEPALEKPPMDPRGYRRCGTASLR